MSGPRGRSPRSVVSDAPIDHARIIDGFGELTGRTHYEDRQVRCGECGIAFTFTARDQKYVHEARGVPIKMAGHAAYCSACLPRRVAANRARRARDAARRLHEEALRAARERPRDPTALLGAAESHLRRLEHAPDRDRATEVVALARRARKIEPACVDTFLWEARGLIAAGHPRAAARALTTLLGRLGESGDRRLHAAATALLAIIPPSR